MILSPFKIRRKTGTEHESMWVGTAGTVSLIVV